MSEKKFHIANFGCRTSQSEGAAIHAELCSAAVAEAESPFDADVLIVNSCTVTEEADRDVRRLIRRVSRRSPATQIIVTGCYAQRRPEELRTMPGVRYVVGNSHKAMVGSLVVNRMAVPVPDGRAEVFCSEIFGSYGLAEPAHQGSAGRTRATVKVQDGCNAACSFCIIPTVRGASRSLPPTQVVANVRALVDRGFREVVLSGIHLGSYGRELEPRLSLLRLIDLILESVPDLERLRLSSIEPMEVSEEIVDLVANHPCVASHLHVPLQSGSSKVLQAMRRPYRAEVYARLVERIREVAADASIGADVMVGFPGETDDDFFQTYRLIEDSPLTYLHVFPYSPRPGTAAAAMAQQVPAHVSRSRGKQLRELIEWKSTAFRSRFVGRSLPVLVLGEEAHSGWRTGISDNFIKVRVPEVLEVNRWHRLFVSRVHDVGLEAALSQDSMTTTAAEMD